MVQELGSSAFLWVITVEPKRGITNSNTFWDLSGNKNELCTRYEVFFFDKFGKNVLLSKHYHLHFLYNLCFLKLSSLDLNAELEAPNDSLCI